MRRSTPSARLPPSPHGYWSPASSPSPLTCSAESTPGNAARTHCSAAHAWFLTAGQTLQLSDADAALQWNALIKMTAMTGTPPERLRDSEFERCQAEIMNVYREGEVFPDTREQRCWFHKIANVLGALPKSAHPGAKKALAEIWQAEDKTHARTAAAAFAAAYRPC